MASHDPQFEDRLNQEYDLRGRTRMAAFLSLALYSVFIGLDAVYTPRYFMTFLFLRLGVMAAVGVILLLLKRAKTSHGVMNLALVLALIDAAGIAVMIYILGGFLTSYYQGLNIIVMGMIVLIPLAFRYTIYLYVSVWFMYTIPSVIKYIVGQKAVVVDGVEIETWRFVINNLTFLTSIIVVGAIGSSYMESIRRRELRSRLQLEETTAQLKESNEKLKSLDELKTQFFANVNHELRTPLTLMLAPLQSLLEGRMGKFSPTHQGHARNDAAQRLQAAQAHQQPPRPEQARGRPDAPQNPGRSTSSTSSRPCSTRSSPWPTRGRSAFITSTRPMPSICRSTRTSSKRSSSTCCPTPSSSRNKGGKITIYIDDKDDTVITTVEDTGIGIPDDMLERIFDRFSQVDGSKSRAQEGTGIGLALAREIVLVHKGTIRAESELGKGSRFIVELRKGEAHFDEGVLDRRTEDVPIGLKRRTTDTEEPRVQDIVTDFRRLQLVDLEKVDIEGGRVDEAKVHDALILCVDDNPEVLKLMKMLLADEFDLELVTSAEQGLAFLRAKNPDLVLCDVMMPGMDGHAFSRAVKSDESPSTSPSSWSPPGRERRCWPRASKAGADDYISKPFDSTELKARIRSQLRMRQMETELTLVNKNLRMRTSDLVEQQRSLFLSTVKSLVSAIDAKDEYTRHHSTRVTDFSLKIAAKMGFSEKEIGDLELAALLHDVGKIAVPESILNKPGKLTKEEFEVIKEHPVRGEAILSPVIELKEISRVVRAHHERYDGTGYPDRLKGREIPMGARIMTIADTYDSITSERPYRKAASHRYAMKEIIACSGTQFDPEVVEHFLEIAGTFVPDQEPENGA